MLKKRKNEMTFRERDIKISPFALVEGEKLIFLPENENARNLFLRDIQKQIIEFVNKHLWLSSKMIAEHFEEYDVQEVKKHIKFLCNNSYLRAAIFTTGVGRSSARVYCLGWRGRRELLRLGVEVNRYSEMEKHTACVVKEVMSANQLILKTGLEKDCVLRKPIFTTSTLFNKKCFRVAGYVENENHYLFNSIRSHSAEEITEKADRMYSTLKRRNCISCHNKNIIIVCICDSEEHKKDVAEIIENSKLSKLKNIQLIYVHDTAVNFGNELPTELLIAV